MRLPQPRKGERIQIRNKMVPFSFWPTKIARRGRYRLQSLLFALDPWAIITQTIAADCPAASRLEALACVDQGRDFFVSAHQAGALEARPLTLYYSYMNLVKAFCLTRGTQTTFDKAQHGLSEQLSPGGAELTGAFLKAFPSPNQRNELQNFAEFMRALEGASLAANASYELLKLLPQIVPGHRLWARAVNRPERFIILKGIQLWHDPAGEEMWLNLYFLAEDLTRLDISHKRLLNEAGLSTFHEVTTQEKSQEKKLICFEQSQPLTHSGYLSDRLHELVAFVRPHIWTTVATVSPFRRYYVYLCPPSDRAALLPQLLSIYAISYYLGSITRYRPHHYPRIVQGVFGPRIQDFVTGQPLQFLYLMASEFARQDVTKPAIL